MGEYEEIVKCCFVDEYGRWTMCFDVPIWVIEESKYLRVMPEGREGLLDTVFVKKLIGGV